MTTSLGGGYSWCTESNLKLVGIEHIMGVWKPNVNYLQPIASLLQSSNFNSALTIASNCDVGIFGNLTVSGTVSGGSIVVPTPNLDASNIVSGVLSGARLPPPITITGACNIGIGTTTGISEQLVVQGNILSRGANGFIGVGSSLSNLNASLVTYGTLDKARLPAALNVTTDVSTLTITSLCNVGIGTTTGINDRLVVQGNTMVYGNVSSTGFIGVGSNLSNLNASLVSSGTLDKARLPGALSIGTDVQTLTITSGCNIGIGTSTGIADKLVVQGNTSIIGRTQFTGNVGIGTATPTFLLEVWNAARIVGSTTRSLLLTPPAGANSSVSTIQMWGTFGSSADYGPRYSSRVTAGYNGGTWGTEYLAFGVGTGAANDAAADPTERMRIAGNGFVGIGTNNPQFPLQVSGGTVSISASGDIAAYSDSNFKENIERIPNALEKVSKLNGYTFTRKNDDSGKRFTGVIAQEVQEVLPEVVYNDNGSNLSVAYGNMIGLLIEAIKELKEQNAELLSKLDVR